MRNYKYPVLYFPCILNVPADYDRQCIITDVNGKQVLVGIYSPDDPKYNRECLTEDLGVYEKGVRLCTK